MIVGTSIDLIFAPDNDTNDLLGIDIMNGVTFAFLFNAVIAGVVEELIGRGWTRWNSQKSIILFLSIQTIFGFLLTGWSFGILIGIICLSTFIFYKKSARPTVALIVGTSLTFALAHMGRIIQISWTDIFYIMQNFGFGLVACYIALNHKLWHAMVFHSLWNLIAVIILSYGLFVAENEEISFTDGGICFEAKANLQPKGFEYSISDSLIHYNATIEGAVEHMLKETNNCLDIDPLDIHTLYRYDYDPMDANAYDISIRDEAHLLKPNKLRRVVRLMERNGIIALDTSYEKTQYIGMIDSTKGGDGAKGSYSLRDLVIDLRMKFQRAVFAEHGMDKEMALPNELEQEINRAKTWESCREIVGKYNLKCYEHQENKTQVIRITKKV